jgi:Flp pilus assembly protein CpaB
LFWARVRSIAVRHRVVRRVLAVGVVAVVGLIGAGVVAKARAAQDSWGRSEVIVVAAADLSIGSSTNDGDFEFVSWPAALVPPDALRSLPVTDRLVTTVLQGEPVTGRDLASAREHALELAPGMRAIGFPTHAGMPPMQAGDLVDLVLVEDPFGVGDRFRVLDPPGLVLDVNDDGVALAVHADLVGEVLNGQTNGRVSFAVR